MIFSERDLSQLNDRFNARFYDQRGKRFFTTAAQECDDRTNNDHARKLWVQSLLSNSSESFHYAVEAFATKHDSKHQRAQAFFLLAYIDSYWEEYFSADENVYLPIDWTEHCYQEEVFFIKGQVLNLKAERLADELLAAHDASDG